MLGLILDCEVNSMDLPEAIEVAVLPVEFDGGRLVQADSMAVKRFKPVRKMDPGALAVHNILPCELEDEDSSEGAKAWVQELAGNYQAEYAVGHNVDFDLQALGFEKVKRVCTLGMARELYPAANAYSLTALTYYLFGFTEAVREAVKGAHGAAADVTLTFELAKTMAEAKDINDWESLHFVSESARIPKKMPFGKHKGESINAVPTSYFTWLLKQDNIDPYLEKAVRRALAARGQKRA